MWAAEDAVREEFDRNRDPNRVEIEATSASIEDATQRGPPQRMPSDNNSQDQGPLART